MSTVEIAEARKIALEYAVCQRAGGLEQLLKEAEAFFQFLIKKSADTETTQK
jgi:hypothetical protein